MSNISGKITLTALKHVIQKKKGKDGKEIDTIVIPIEANSLFLSEKGNVFLDFQAGEYKEKKEDRKDTHWMRQSMPKEKYQAMSEEQKNEIPWLGSFIVWGGGSSESVPNSASAGTVLEEDDDLPF